MIEASNHYIKNYFTSMSYTARLWWKSVRRARSTAMRFRWIKLPSSQFIELCTIISKFFFSSAGVVSKLKYRDSHGITTERSRRYSRAWKHVFHCGKPRHIRALLWRSTYR
ncbi:hypothetical protein X801_04868 [Opisthorchis viverrini]|uniref:Uncharacterized protein n=1 Tax=Opisthorchis viverrini TaxID=6198 RepID=A0A1S8WXT1_OPIVI|nr:hypothetical protein X801_04868 [Opisthorchis viverrini]